MPGTIDFVRKTGCANKGRIFLPMRACFIQWISLALLAASTSTGASGPSATISLTSDYVFRGISFTDGPALQGSIDYAFANGAYVGSWTSNYDFDTETKQELDFYVGYSHKLNDLLSVTTNAFRYTFIDEHVLDYNEYNIGLTYRFINTKIWHASNYGGSNGDANYYEIGYDATLPNEYALSLRAGHSTFATEIGINDYTDFVIAINKKFGRFSSSIQLSDTDESQFADREKARAVIAVSTTFE